MDAVVALRCFVDAFSDQEAAALKPLIPALLDEFFKLMNEVGTRVIAVSAWQSDFPDTSHGIESYTVATCSARPLQQPLRTTYPGRHTWPCNVTA